MSLRPVGINPGDYNRRLMFQEKTQTQDENKALVETWADWFPCMGAYEPAGSREFPVRIKRFTETTARFRVPFMPGRTIDPSKHRIVMTFDPTANPAVQSIWDISAPLPMPPTGAPMEWHIEAHEFK